MAAVAKQGRTHAQNTKFPSVARTCLRQDIDDTLGQTDPSPQKPPPLTRRLQATSFEYYCLFYNERMNEWLDEMDGTPQPSIIQGCDRILERVRRWSGSGLKMF